MTPEISAPYVRTGDALTLTTRQRSVRKPRLSAARSLSKIPRVGLTTYQRCAYTGERAVLRAIWSRNEGETDNVVQAARDDGPFALVMVALTTVEFVVISIALLTASNRWA